jgi:hypothetical protein
VPTASNPAALHPPCFLRTDLRGRSGIITPAVPLSF